MHHRTDIVYQYDGSFDGFLCCVFRAVYQREDPMAIFSENGAQVTLLETALIDTEPDKAGRVLRSIPAKMGTDALRAVQWCFLSDLEDRETAILAFLRLGYRVGSPVMRMLTDPCVHKVVTAARNVANEAHLLKGFTRFSDHGGALVAEIEPKNHVLPILARHFRARMPGESFLIHDRTHKLVLLCSGGCCQILPLEELSLPRADGQEQLYRQLWTRFYDTVSIESRYNPRCRMTHMPKRYWAMMTEFQPESQAFALPEVSSPSSEKLR